jgi:peptidylprolyl isomerase
MSIMSISYAADDNESLGRAGELDVSIGEARKYLESLPEADRAVLAKDSGKLTQVVRTYIADRSILKAARDVGFDQQPEIKTKLEQAQAALLGEFYLRSVTNVPDAYSTDAEVQAAYDGNKSAFVTPRRYRLAQIFIAAPQEEKVANARVDALMKKIKAKGSDFTAIAREYSDSKNEAARGGEIGWLAEPVIAPEIRLALPTLAKGAVSAPIRLTNGWHIVQLLDSRPAGTEPLPFAEVKSTLAEQMRRQRVTNERQAYVSGLLTKSPVVINELALSKLIRR